ncbi:MAG: hypothetical protein AAGA58_09135 [Verrucomicrobiota bacterium]
MPLRILLAILFGLSSLLSNAEEVEKSEIDPDLKFEQANGPRVFLIGNSLTWDTVPSRLDGPVRWHVDCGKSLPFIFANPDKPCVKTSTLWPAALKTHRYDILSFQTHYGSTVVEDAVTISQWIEMQPNARIILHTGWARALEAVSEYVSDSDFHLDEAKMAHSPSYIEKLMARLKENFPNTEFSQTHAQELVIRIANNVAAGEGPFEDMRDIYRDKIHMNVVTGRYLMHNAMRLAVGQPRSVVGFEKIPDDVRAYFDGHLDWLEKRRDEDVTAPMPTPKAIAIAGAAKAKADAEAAIVK